jgi:hypothetical protein
MYRTTAEIPPMWPRPATIGWRDYAASGEAPRNPLFVPRINGGRWRAFVAACRLTHSVTKSTGEAAA